eukprot:Skav225203  [mRNA]  locus=scaffold1041:16815:23916:- [translate_table: standard]
MQQFVIILRTNASSTIMMVGCMDGSVLKISLQTGDELLCKTLHSPYNGGTAQVVCSRDSTVAMSTGGADGILVWSEPGSDIMVSPDDSHIKEPNEDAFSEETAAQFAFECGTCGTTLGELDLHAPRHAPWGFGQQPVSGGDATKGEDEVLGGVTHEL